MNRNRIPIIITKVSKLILVLLGFQLIGCYENVDNTEQTEVLIELPQIITDAELSGRFEEVGGLLIDSDFELVIGDNVFSKSNGEFYVSLEKVNKINQLIKINIDNEIVSLANIPLIANELHTITLNPLEKVASLTVSEGNLSIGSERMLFSFSGDDALAQGNSEVIINNLTDHLGYSGVIDNTTRVVLSHIQTVLVQSDNPTSSSPVTATVDVTNLPTTGNVGIFKFDEVIGNWKLVKAVETSMETIELPLFGMLSIAEYVPCVVYEGDVKGNDLSLVYQKIEVNNPSLTNGYAHYSTYGGKYLAFFEKEVESEITSLGCQSQSTTLLSIDSQDAKGQTMYFEDGDYGGMLVKPLVFDCNGDVGPSQYATLCKGENKVALQNETAQIVTTCENVDLSLQTLLDDGTRFSLPWDASIQDSIIYLPTCAGYDQGYTYMSIRGEDRVYPVFTIDKIDGNTILRSSDDNIQLILRGQEMRTYSEEEVGIIVNNQVFGDSEFYANCGTSTLGCGLDYCQVTHADEGWFRVSFGGRVWMQTVAPSAVAGNFYVSGNILIKE